jgi:hypothetical protein
MFQFKLSALIILRQEGRREHLSALSGVFLDPDLFVFLQGIRQTVSVQQSNTEKLKNGI